MPADKDVKELNVKIWDMKKQINMLSIFKRKERRELENALAEEENALEEAEKERDRQKAELISSIDDKISTLQKNFEEQSKSLSEMISSLQEKVPEDNTEPSSKFLNREERKAYDEKKVFNALRRTGRTTVETLLREEELNGFTTQRVVHMLTNLMKKGCVEKDYIATTAYFKVVNEYKE